MALTSSSGTCKVCHSSPPGTFPHKTTLIRIKADYLVQFRFDRTFLQRKLHPAAVGQYLFLNFPVVSLTEWHPFSLSSGPLEVDMEVHIRALGDWTKMVFSKAARAEREGRQLTVRVDGPYGNLRFSYFRYPRIFMVVGGIGVTPAIGLLKDIYRTGELSETAQSFRRVVRIMKVVWVVQSFSQVEWFREELDEFLRCADENPNGPQLDLEVYVTRSKDEEESLFGGYTVKGKQSTHRQAGPTWTLCLPSTARSRRSRRWFSPAGQRQWSDRLGR